MIKNKCQNTTPKSFKICPDPLEARKTNESISVVSTSTNLFKSSTYAATLGNEWGACLDPATDPVGFATCITGEKMGEFTGDLIKYVGAKTVETLFSVCKCKSNYGPFCTWSEAPTNLCENGKLNVENYLSGCECRNSDGVLLPYHGWYCEIHNRVLCEDDEKFYDASKMKKVGDSSSRVCKPCEEIIKNCGECEQEEGELFFFYLTLL